MSEQVPAMEHVRPRLADGGALLTLLLSIAMGVLAYDALPNNLRIHWGSPYYGPEFAPKLLVVVAFPLLVAVLYLGLRLLTTLIAGFEEFERVRPVFEWAVVATLLFLVAVQAVLLWVNVG